MYTNCVYLFNCDTFDTARREMRTKVDKDMSLEKRFASTVAGRNILLTDDPLILYYIFTNDYIGQPPAILRGDLISAPYDCLQIPLRLTGACPSPKA